MELQQLGDAAVEVAKQLGGVDEVTRMIGFEPAELDDLMFADAASTLATQREALATMGIRRTERELAIGVCAALASMALQTGFLIGRGHLHVDGVRAGGAPVRSRTPADA